MEYVKLTQENIDQVARNFMDYYNSNEDGCWEYERAYKRIHQFMTIEDSECLVQYDNGEMTGFVIGFYKPYDDLTSYCLEEIVIFARYQNKGYGSALLEKIDGTARSKGAHLVELSSVNDEHHMHFYKKSGYYITNTLKLMGKEL